MTAHGLHTAVGSEGFGGITHLVFRVASGVGWINELRFSDGTIEFSAWLDAGPTHCGYHDTLDAALDAIAGRR